MTGDPLTYLSQHCHIHYTYTINHPLFLETRVFFPIHNPSCRKKIGFGGMGRAPCCDKANVKKGPWSPEEDTKLKEFIDKYGTGGNWIALPSKAGLKRCGKSCRLRWLNYLRPNIKHGEFSDDEDRIICSLFASIGSRWSIIAARLPGRTDNDIKNYWNTKLKKKLLGIAPSQRKPHHPQQQQMLFSSPSPSSHTTQRALLTSLDQVYPIAHHHHDMFMTSNPSLLLQDTQQYQMDSTGSNLLMFGGHEQSCSSSDGSCNQISYGQGMEYKIGGGEQMMGFDQGYPHGSIMENQQKGNGLWNDQSLEYGYEEIKQLLISSSSGCNSSIYVQDDPAATSSATAAAKGGYRTQGKIMYNF